MARDAHRLAAARAAEIAVFAVGQARPEILEGAVFALAAVNVPREQTEDREAEHGVDQQRERRPDAERIERASAEKDRQQIVEQTQTDCAAQQKQIKIVGAVTPVHEAAHGLGQASKHNHHLILIIAILDGFTSDCGQSLRIIYVFIKEPLNQSAAALSGSFVPAYRFENLGNL